MRNRKPQKTPPDANAAVRSTLLTVMAAGCLLLLILVMLRPRRAEAPVGQLSAGAPAQDASQAASNAARDRLFARLPHPRSAFDPAPTPEQVVSNKVAQFARSRREILQAMARHHGIAVPEDVERFFKAAEEGRWEEMDALFKSMSERKKSDAGAEELSRFFHAVLDAYGAAEQAHLWPAQKLLDYGHAVLDSLRPGMAYVGGTDEGRWIPALLTDTGEGERHIVVTQNGLADQSYLEYLRFLYGDSMTTLTKEDSQRAFQEYLADAQERFRHDQQFPEEPKQVRPGEDIQMIDNRVQVSGQVAVMAINERLLQNLMQNNPEMSFALQESFPLRSTYGGAAPLGPIMELGAQDSPSAFTAERAAQSVDYWRAAARQLVADPEASASPETLKSYSKLATGQANLFGDRNYSAEAEQTYRLATVIWPGNVEAVSGLTALLDHSGRSDEARKLAEDFERRYPEMRSDLERGRAMCNFTVTTPRVLSGAARP